MTRNRRLDRIGRRIAACKFKILGVTTRRDRQQIERELRAIGNELAGMPHKPIFTGTTPEKEETHTPLANHGQHKHKGMKL